MQREFDTLRCVVSSKGNVTCNPVFNLKTTCGHSARHWPMDEHECVFEMASRNHDGREYLITVASNDTVWSGGSARRQRRNRGAGLVRSINHSALF